MLATATPTHDRTDPGELPAGSRSGLTGIPCAVRTTAACVVTLALFLLCTSHSDARSDTAIDPRHEYNVKAAFLYSFGRYVSWPAETRGDRGNPFVIGLLGQDPFGGALETIAATKNIQGRVIMVRHFKSVDELEPCHILFIPKTTATKEQTAAIRKLRAKHTLLVGEVPGFTSRGGTLSFYIDQDRVRFEINVESANRQRLAFDAKLLKLATTMKGP